MSVDILYNQRAAALENSRGEEKTRLVFSRLDRETFRIAIRQGGEKPCCLLSSWVWVPMTVEGKDEPVYVNISSAAKRLDLSRSQVVDLCKNGALINWTQINEARLKKLDSALPYARFKMGEAKKLIDFLEECKKTYGKQPLSLYYPRLNLNILYANQNFYVPTNEVLGEGSFKTVVKAYGVNTENDPNELFALLIQKRRSYRDVSPDREQFFSEVLSGLPGFPKLLGVIDYVDDLGMETFFLQPYFERGDLFDAINSKGLKLIEKDKIAEDLLSGLVVLKREQIIHSDIKPENILLTGEGADVKAVITDFGLAIDQAPNASYTKIMGGTKSYLPLERHLNRMKGSEDVWAMGIVLTELYFEPNSDFYRLVYSVRSALERYQKLREKGSKNLHLHLKGKVIPAILKLKGDYPYPNSMEGLIASMMHISPGYRSTPEAALAIFQSLIKSEIA